MSVMNEKQQVENAYHLREQAERDFKDEYKDVTVGDPRLMALWDLCDRVDAELFENHVRRDKEATDNAKLASVVRLELVKDRIDKRSPKVPGYSAALVEAGRQHRLLVTALLPTSHSKTLDVAESMATSIMQNFAREATKSTLTTK